MAQRSDRRCWMEPREKTLATTDPYENERLHQTCKRISDKLKSKCEGVKEIDGDRKDCLDRKEDFEGRCAICQARSLLAFLQAEAGTIERSNRLKADLMEASGVPRHTIRNWKE